MTRMMGHSAVAKPSRADVAKSAAGMRQSVSASTAATASALRHALCPGIFK